MAKYDSTHCGYLLCGKYNVLNVSKTIELNTTTVLEDTTPLGAPNPVMQFNVKKNEITGHEGWYDDATDSINALMVGMASTQEVFMFAYEGNVEGKHAACSHGVIRSEYKRMFTVNELHKAQMGLSVTGAMDDAFIVHHLHEETTASGNNENLDLDYGGTAGSLGGNVYLVCTALTLGGYTNCVITFEDSPDGTTYSPQTAMTGLTAPGAEWKAMTESVVNHFHAVAWSFTGTGSGPKVTFTLATKVNR